VQPLFDVTEPLSWQVLQYVQAIVGRITQAAGYRTDLGAGEVTLDTSTVDENATTPYTTVAAGAFAGVDANSGRRTLSGDMEVAVQYAVPLQSGVNAELLAHRGRADLVRAIHAENPRERPQGLRTLEITGSTLGDPENGAAVVIAQVTLRASLSETHTPA
jgi:hypothetical protein